MFCLVWFLYYQMPHLRGITLIMTVIFRGERRTPVTEVRIKVEESRLKPKWLPSAMEIVHHYLLSLFAG